jgi:hypothetical protein
MNPRWIITFVLILIAGILIMDNLHEAQLMRRVSISEGKAFLKMAYNDYLGHGYVTNYGNSNYQIWLMTNEFVTIGATQYQCFLEVRLDKIYGAGALAMTTNQTFIWLDSKRPPKIIDRNYSPTFFPPGF